MSLRDKTKDQHLCWERTEGIESLRIELETGDIYTFPYIHLSHSHLTRSSKGHSLEIHLTSHTVTITGQNLRDLSLALQKNALSWIKTAHGSSPTSKKSVSIKTIHITKGTPSGAAP